jgi:glycosyltransferase involved in cell wall biosynthesis
MDAYPIEPVRVAFDVGPLSGARTGIGHAVCAMRDALDERDDVVLSPYLISFRTHPADGVQRFPIPAALAHRAWARGDRPRVDRWLRGSHPPVAVVHGTNYVVPPTLLPRVVSVYDCWFLHNPQWARPDVRRAGQVLRRAVAGGAVVHASSHATARAVTELFPTAAVSVVPLGALPAPSRPDDAPIAELVGRPFVVAIGTIERRKNLAALVTAFGLLAQDHPEVALVLAGDGGDDREAVEAAVDAAGTAVARRVLFTGRVDAATRSWLLRNAAVMAYPSLDEGFGFPVLDAMRVGVPVVGSNAGSIPEVAGDAALLCAPTDVEALARNLAVALTDPGERARLVAAGDQQWRRFTWDRCAAGLAQLYHRLATGGTP